MKYSFIAILVSVVVLYRGCLSLDGAPKDDPRSDADRSSRETFEDKTITPKMSLYNGCSRHSSEMIQIVVRDTGVAGPEHVELSVHASELEFELSKLLREKVVVIKNVQRNLQEIERIVNETRLSGPDFSPQNLTEIDLTVLQSTVKNSKRASDSVRNYQNQLIEYANKVFALHDELMSVRDDEKMLLKDLNIELQDYELRKRSNEHDLEVHRTRIAELKKKRSEYESKQFEESKHPRLAVMVNYFFKFILSLFGNETFKPPTNQQDEDYIKLLQKVKKEIENEQENLEEDMENTIKISTKISSIKTHKRSSEEAVKIFHDASYASLLMSRALYNVAQLWQWFNTMVSQTVREAKEFLDLINNSDNQVVTTEWFPHVLRKCVSHINEVILECKVIMSDTVTETGEVCTTNTKSEAMALRKSLDLSLLLHNSDAA